MQPSTNNDHRTVLQIIFPWLHNLRNKYYFQFGFFWFVTFGGMLRSNAQAQCEDFGAASLVGQLPSEIAESSGLAASRKNKGVWWTHNDSGGAPTLFAMDSQGKQLGRFEVVGATNRDWEDIAVAPCPNGDSCIYIGDIGDNGKRYTDIKIYRVPEPTVDSSSTQNGKTATAEVFTLTYPNGPRNAEALIVHPITRDIMIITKEFAERCEVYTLSGQNPSGRATLKRAGDLDNLGDLVTGGDISPDGKIVALRFYTKAALYRVGPDGVPNDANRIKILSMPQTKQAEAIAFSADGRTLLSTSEGQGKDATIHEQSCTSPPQPEPTSEPERELTQNENPQDTEESPSEKSDDDASTETTIENTTTEIITTELTKETPNEASSEPEQPVTGCSGCEAHSPVSLCWVFLFVLLPLLYKQRKAKQ